MTCAGVVYVFFRKTLLFIEDFIHYLVAGYSTPRNLLATIARALSSLHNKRSGFARMIVFLARLISLPDGIGGSFLT